MNNDGGGNSAVFFFSSNFRNPAAQRAKNPFLTGEAKLMGACLIREKLAHLVARGGYSNI